MNWLTRVLPKPLGLALFHARVRWAIRLGQVRSAHIEETMPDAEIERYCRLHIKAQQEIVVLEAQVREACEHLERLVTWGWGNDAPDDAPRDWRAAQAYLMRVSHGPTEKT